MNKADLAAEVAEQMSGAEPDARQYVDAVFDVIMRHVAAGERVQILGFGTFDSVQRAARLGRNPQTGAAIQVPAGTSPRFHAGQTFRTRVAEASAVPAEASQDVAKPVEAKKIKAAKQKAEKKTAKKPEKIAKKPEKVAKKPEKAGKAAGKASKGGKAGKAAKAGKK